MTQLEIKETIEREFNEAINIVCIANKCWEAKDVIMALLGLAYSSGMLKEAEEVRKVMNQNSHHGKEGGDTE